MKRHPLEAISPVDGRYSSRTEELSPYFSEKALIKYRLLVEIEYFIALHQIALPPLKELSSSAQEELREIYKKFSLTNAMRVKEIERTTNHDVKAVEYFLKEELEKRGYGEEIEFIHFGLTSQDINNVALPLSLKEAISKSYLPQIEGVIRKLTALSKEWEEIAMLARTHGQPASPTRLGKEIAVFVARLEEQLSQLKRVKYSAKFGGATGNFNAHHVAYPEIDWNSFANKFIEEELSLSRSYPTTQIEHYDNLAALFDNLKRINTILVDLCRDIWSYISMEYFKQKIKEGEVGSSAMPHKVNPIDFENGEGNLGVANALFTHLSATLPISRLQRDLTDSTLSRNVGLPLAHTIISLKSIERGLDKLIINRERIEYDLEQNWAVVAEAIQTILRREGYPNPYEALKALTRTNEMITQESLANFISQLEIAETVKEELLKISPLNYTGV